MSSKAFISVSGHTTIIGDVDVRRRDHDPELPFGIYIGGIVIFIDFDTLDTIATQAAFTREAWLREQSGVLKGWDNDPVRPAPIPTVTCATCKGTGSGGIDDSCPFCRGEGWVYADTLDPVCAQAIVLGSHHLRCNLPNGHTGDHSVTKIEEV